MKSAAVDCGNFDLRGKKHKRLSCGCCTALNLKEEYFEKLARKEIKEHDPQDCQTK